MKEEVLLYIISAAISITAVAITSVLKMIVVAIAKKSGKDISGNAKEYIFTPIALILAAFGLYIWLDKFLRVENDEKFILIVVCFSVGTMLIYWLLFQPTRKLAKAVIHLIAKKTKLEVAVDTAEKIIEQTTDKPKNAETGKPSSSESSETLRQMVDAIKK